MKKFVLICLSHYIFFPFIMPGTSAHSCEAYIRRYEQQHGIPSKLLSAIALIESGRKMNGKRVAWPWTINANGVPYVFDTKQEAIQKVKDLQGQGIRSIDVGCMQINLYHHPDAFASLEDAFDPEKNIAYAASFLKEKRTAQGNWAHAVAHYHSATQSLNEPYKDKVLQTWSKILDQPTLLPTVSPFLPNASAVKVPLVGWSQRRAPLKVRFAPFPSENRPKPLKQENKLIKPKVYRLNKDRRFPGQPRLIVKERRIPMSVFAEPGEGRYSLKKSSHILKSKS